MSDSERDDSEQELGPAGGNRGSGETILLAEDEPAVRSVIYRLLKQSGYRVLQVGSPGAALELAASGEPIHLLLTDIVMPEMSGGELAKRFSELRPNTPVLFMSGYNREAIVEHGGLREDVGYVEKPFSIENLLQRIREVLDHR